MTLFDQIEGMVERSLEAGRKPVLIRISPSQIPAVEADAKARGVLGRGTIFGFPYESHIDAGEQGPLLIFTDTLPE